MGNGMIALVFFISTACIGAGNINGTVGTGTKHTAFLQSDDASPSPLSGPPPRRCFGQRFVVVSMEECLMLQLGVAKGRGGETCLVAAIVFLLLKFFIQCVGAINSGCWVGRLRISFSMDDGADGTVELLQSGWC